MYSSWGIDAFLHFVHSVSPRYRKDYLMGMLSLMNEFWEFLKTRKRFWLAPIIIILVLLGSLIVFTESSAIAPFIYTLF